MSLLDVTENIEQSDIRVAFIKRVENIITDQFYRSLWPLGYDELPSIHVSVPEKIPQYFTIGVKLTDGENETHKHYRIFDVEQLKCTFEGIIQLYNDSQFELEYNSTWKSSTIGKYVMKTSFPPRVDIIRLRVWKSDDVFDKMSDFGYIDIDPFMLCNYRGLNFINILKEY
jgi:hypothetical protein